MALINCPECNREISDTVKKCPNCGYKINQHNTGDNKRTISKRTIIIGIVLLVVSIAIVGWIILYYIFNSDIRKTKNRLLEGDIVQAQIIFDTEIKNDESKKNELQNDLESLFKDAIDIYSDNQNKYFVFQNIKQFVEKNYQNYNITKFDKDMETMRKSKYSYEDGKKQQKNKQYGDAIKSYSNVIKSDPNYKSAQEESGKCRKEYKNIIINKIDNMLAEKNPTYEDIQTEIWSQEYLKKDKEVLSKFDKLKDKVRDFQVINAQTLAGKMDYLKAFEALNKIPADCLLDESVVKTKNTIVDGMLKWVTNEVTKIGKEKKYGKAIEFLEKYKSYDRNGVIQKKISYYEKKEKKKIISEFKRLKKNLTIKYDSVDQDYEVVYRGYSTKYVNISHTINLEARAIVDKKDKDVNFALVAGFEQDDWIFTEQVKFASGKYRATYLIEYSDRYTQVDYGSIAEWMYLDSLSNADLFDGMKKLVSHISTSQKATVRFSAPGNGSRNHVITSSEKRNMRIVFRFCELLQKYNYLYKYI